MQDFMIAIPFIGFALVFVGIFVFAFKYEKKRRAKVAVVYQKIADTFNLTFVPEQKRILWNYHYPKVVGEIDGLAIKLYSYTTGGKNKVTYTSFSITSATSIPDLKIIKQGLFQKIAKTFGGQDILIGNPELDNKFVFKCDDEALLVKVLDAEIQQMLLYLSDKLLAPLTLNKGSIFSYTFVNHIDSEEKRAQFEKVMVLMLKIIGNVRQHHND